MCVVDQEALARAQEEEMNEQQQDAVTRFAVNLAKVGVPADRIVEAVEMVCDEFEHATAR
jgi:hypothetical protein